MKFSENWLRQHIPTAASRDELVATLTAIGLEVEEVTALGEALDGVVAGRIIKASPHPEADRLQVCEVDAGAAGTVQIVCGAPNARASVTAIRTTTASQYASVVWSAMSEAASRAAARRPRKLAPRTTTAMWQTLSNTGAKAGAAKR